MKHAGLILKIVFVLVLVGISLLIFFRPKKTHMELFQQEYSALVEKYPDLDLPYDLFDVPNPVLDDLWLCEDDMIVLAGFFEQDEDFSFEEAQEAYDHLRTIYYTHCYY